MLRKTISIAMLLLFVLGTLTLASKIQLAKATGMTIYINADGSISPPTAPVSTVDNVTYVLTTNVASDTDGIVIERNNIFLDGAGYVLSGPGQWELCRGVSLIERSNVTIQDLNIRNYCYGIALSSSSQINVSNNVIADAFWAIALEYSSNNTLFNNYVNLFFNGIDLHNSSGNYIAYNSIEGYYSAYSNIGIYFRSSCQNNVFCNDVTGNGNGYGILLQSSCNNSLFRNTPSNNRRGISIESSGTNILSNNGVSWNYYGITLSSSDNNSLLDNNLTPNGDGIILSYSATNNISNNLVTSWWEGIHLDCSSNNALRNNTIKSDDKIFGVSGKSILDFVNDIDVSNTAGGKPIYYLINEEDLLADPVMFPQVGYLALVNCTDITVEGLRIVNNNEGLLLAFTQHSRITNNTLTNNSDGIVLFSSSSNSLTGNNITNNGEGILFAHSSNYNNISGNNITDNGRGIRLDSCSNSIYHNNFASNAISVECNNSTNIWDDGYPSGGNYWSDYQGIDECSGFYQNVAGSDGIGDKPYLIGGGNADCYPLMQPWIPTPQQFLNVTLVTSIPERGTWVYAGQTVYVNVTVLNWEPLPEQVWVTLYYNVTAGMKSIDAHSVTLDAGQNFTLPFAWNTSSMPCSDFTLTAVTTVPMGLSTSSSGNVRLRIMGEVSGDGLVNMKDLATAIQAFHSWPGKEKWNPDCDLDLNGLVDMRDVMTIVMNFNSHS